MMPTIDPPPCPEIPLHIELLQQHKDFVVYFNADSQSSAEDAPPDKTHPDDKYIPPTADRRIEVCIAGHFIRIFHCYTFAMHIIRKFEVNIYFAHSEDNQCNIPILHYQLDAKGWPTAVTQYPNVLTGTEGY